MQCEDLGSNPCSERHVTNQQEDQKKKYGDLRETLHKTFKNSIVQIVFMFQTRFKLGIETIDLKPT